MDQRGLCGRPGQASAEPEQPTTVALLEPAPLGPGMRARFQGHASGAPCRGRGPAKPGTRGPRNHRVSDTTGGGASGASDGSHPSSTRTINRAATAA